MSGELNIFYLLNSLSKHLSNKQFFFLVNTDAHNFVPGPPSSTDQDRRTKGGEVFILVFVSPNSKNNTIILIQ